MSDFTAMASSNNTSTASTAILESDLLDISESKNHAAGQLTVLLMGEEEEAQTPAAKTIAVRVQRALLTEASPVFESLLSAVTVDNPTIRIPYLMSETFQTILCYINEGKLNVTSFKKALDVYHAACKLQMEQLGRECMAYMCNHLTVQCACQAYETGVMFRDDILVEESLKFIKTNIQQIIQDPSFEDVELSTVVKIFSMEDLEIESELDLFQAAERYEAKRNSVSRSYCPETKRRKLCEQAGADENELQANVEPILVKDEQNGDLQDATNTYTIADAVKHIRLLTLPADVLARHVARSRVLDPRAALCLLVHAAHPCTPLALPPGLSASRERRHQCKEPPKVNSKTTIKLTLPAKPTVVLSPPHLLLDRPWRVKLLPRYEGETGTTTWNQYLGVFIGCGMSQPATWACRVTASVRLLILEAGVTKCEKVEMFEKIYTSVNTNWGYPCFVSLSDLKDPVAVSEGAVSLEVEMEAEELRPHEARLPRDAGPYINNNVVDKLSTTL